ncbi:RNA methyltransferase [Candidatus Poribacteria bacterium]|jgi:tRNA (guanine6-N2)-methyltransferase|nr:RNA methyltransferase [Candidatus Poribacteria bacterium]MBT5532609.1 RNA methyltransferase [Candidatus Poribacteria bacterium]MBT5712147.1 RNA methyltransferase [Candidatus Poribacteria bacterium]MBT7806071.1 RNA methyltransferase [Candidatus Poribacteria bacterium]
MEYYAFTTQGLESITAREVEYALPDAVVTRARGGIVRFTYSGEQAPLLRLGTTEDVYAYIADGTVSRERKGKHDVARRLAASPHWHEAVGAARALKRKDVKRITFRVVSQRPGGDLAYRRADVQRTAADAVQAMFPRWKEVEDDSHLEIWVLQDDEYILAGVRLSDRRMRHRTYKVAHIGASLKPTIACSMAWLTNPEPNDIFLDPMCGAGTILIERAYCMPYLIASGGDADAGALAAARDNLLSVRRPVSLTRWDATHLPVPDGTVSRIASNLPFGKQHSEPEDLRALYTRFLREADRVLEPGGRMVLLTSQSELLRDILRGRRRLRYTETYRLTVLGTRATIYCIDASY